MITSLGGGEGNPKNLKKGNYGAGAGPLKRGLTLFLFNFFKVYHFYIYIFFIFTFTFTLPFAKLCYAFEEKLFFSVTIIL